MKARELPHEAATEGTPLASSARPLVANDSARPPTRLNKAMEDEVYSLLGALLGMLEVLSIDVQDPLTERQRRFVNDALRFGDMLRTRVEAMVTLCGDERDARFARAPYALRRLIDHAVRAASWAAAAKGVNITLPAREGWDEDLLLIDAPRVDRALRSITDTLVAALGKDGQVVLHVEDRPHSVFLTLQAHNDGQVPAPALSLSTVLFAAWEHVFRQQEGSLRVDTDNLRVFMELPKVTPGGEP